MLKYLLPFCCLTLLVFQAVAQHVHTDECATVNLQRKGLSDEAFQSQTDNFEAWIRKKRNERARKRTDAELLTIPVVVHVIHNGEPVGSGINISDEQIIDHIQSVSEDFRAQNPELTGIVSGFRDLIMDSEIEFCMAQRDPEGLPTTGIVRVNGGRSGWGFQDNRGLKSQSHWPPEDYLNIWVTDLVGGLAGYAQFPETDDLEGLAFGRQERLTDGIVVDFNVFRRGARRTTSHEIGHYLGLRHIWGDGDCRVDDFCEDTPNAAGPHRACDGGQESCGELNNIQNIMDYSDCRYMFTPCQAERMRVIMDNSPRRASLKDSKGCQAPIITEYNAGIRDASRPTLICTHGYTPEVEIRNYGTEPLTSVQVGYFFDGEDRGIVAEWTGNLANLETDIFTLPELEVTPGDHSIVFYTNNPSNNEDGDPDNDDYRVDFLIIDEEPVGLQSFNSDIFPPQNWTINNPDGSYTWKDTVMTDGNNATAIDLAYYSDRGQFDRITSPIFDLTDFDRATLHFRVAYARVQQDGDLISDNEGLRVQISNNCGRTFANVYSKFNDELATYGPHIFTDENPASAPASDADWRRERVDISRFAGAEIILTFSAVNDFGNTLWLDDIEISSVTSTEELELLNESFKLYPNPTQGRLFLQFNDLSEDYEVKVFNMSGQIITSESFHNISKASVDLSGEAPGVYLVQIRKGEDYTTRKIILSK